MNNTITQDFDFDLAQFPNTLTFRCEVEYEGDYNKFSYSVFYRTKDITSMLDQWCKNMVEDAIIKDIEQRYEDAVNDDFDNSQYTEWN